MNSHKTDAKLAGMTAAILSIMITLVISLLISPPWGILTILLAIGVATYASGYAVAAAS